MIGFELDFFLLQAHQLKLTNQLATCTRKSYFAKGLFLVREEKNTPFANMVKPQCLKTSDCDNAICVNGKCKSRNIPQLSRCADHKNCSGYDKPGDNKVTCENDFCIGKGYKNPMDEGKKCRQNVHCGGKNRHCYNSTCYDYKTDTKDYCNDKDKKCDEELACYGDRCRERCWVERDGEMGGGCREEGKVCRKVAKFPYFDVCLPKGMVIAKQDTTEPATPSPTTTTPTPTTDTKATDGIFKDKAVWLVGGVAGLVIAILIVLICLILVKKRSHKPNVPGTQQR